MTGFLNVALCSIVEVDRRFTDVYCFHHQGGCPEAATTSEISVNFYDSTQRNIP
jgi:hypothetical protein